MKKLILLMLMVSGCGRAPVPENIDILCANQEASIIARYGAPARVDVGYGQTAYTYVGNVSFVFTDVSGECHWIAVPINN